jgi:carboxylesterase type B
MLETTQQPCIQDLGDLGYISGATIIDKKTSEPICHFFGGVPYALPPTDEHRWTKPRELPPNYKYGTRSKPGRFPGRTAVCPQLSANRKAKMDENCLQLNLWIPAGPPPPSGWPIYFYIRMSPVVPRAI